MAKSNKWKYWIIYILLAASFGAAGWLIGILIGHAESVLFASLGFAVAGFVLKKISKEETDKEKD